MPRKKLTDVDKKEVTAPEASDDLAVGKADLGEVYFQHAFGESGEFVIAKPRGIELVFWTGSGFTVLNREVNRYDSIADASKALQLIKLEPGECVFIMQTS